MDPRAIAETEHDAPVEAARPGQVDLLEAGILVAQPGPLEAPLQGSGAAVGDLAVDQQGEPVLERHVAEVAARDLLEEGGLHAGQAQRGQALGHRVGQDGFGHL